MCGRGRLEGILSLMRTTLFTVIAAFSSLCYGAVSTVQVGDPARQQGVVTFRVKDPGQCTITVYRDSALTDKVEDTNNSVFAGSESCARPYNVIDGRQVTAVIGRRTSEAASSGKLVSRSLEVNRAYYVLITDLTDSASAQVSFTTANIPWGDTHIEEVPYNAAGFNRWAYPDLDWTDAGSEKEYVDPISGVRIRRYPRNIVGKGGPGGDDINFEFAFLTALDVSGAWTNVQNVLNTSVAGPFASYAGPAQAQLFLPFRFDGPVGQPWKVDGYSWEDTRVKLYGYAASTGNVEDQKVLVCLAANFNPASSACASAEIELTLPVSPGFTQGPSAYPSYGFSGWNLPRPLTAGELAIPNGAATVANSSVTLSSGFLPPNAEVGMKININGSWYTIGALGTARRFTLAEAGVNASGNWFLGYFGTRLRKKTATANQINVAATFNIVYSQNVQMPANGVRDFCHTLTFPVNFQADGVTAMNPPKRGRLCYDGYSLSLLLEDGSMRYLSSLSHPDSSWQGVPQQIPLGAFSQTDPYALIGMHTDDSGPAGSSPERRKRVFYEITYNPNACHFKSWTGNAYRTLPDPQDCVTWVNKTPAAGGRTITDQMAAATSNPIWDATLSNWSLDGLDSHHFFELRAVSGRWASLNLGLSQDNPCILAVFDMTNYTLVKMFDSLSGALPGLRWAGCHANGMDIPYGSDYGTGGYTQLTARNQAGYLSGPMILKSVTAKSLDSGTTWNANTSLTNVQAANCGPNPYGITGLQCVKLKLSSDKPCNINAPPGEAAKWPCPWHSGWSNPLGMGLDAGDSFSRISNDDSSQPVSPDGKREKFRILTKTSDGSGGWIVEVQRWSACDNITSDFSKGAVQYYDHLYTGQGGNTHPNGWNGTATPNGGCAGTLAWINLPKPLATTDWSGDNTQISVSHSTFGIGPDGVQLMQVGNSGSKIGGYPAMAGTSPDVSFSQDSSSFARLFRGSGDEVESYPSLSNWTAPTVQRRSLYWDFRHINPATGSSPEYLTGPFGQIYAPVSGQQYTYKVNSFADVGSFKERPPNVFATNGAYKNVSGPGSVINDSKLYSYCQAYAPGECVSAPVPAAKGEVFVVAPNAHIEPGRCSADTYTTYSPCVTPLWSHGAWMTEGDARKDDPLGTRFRRITMGLSGPTAQYQYTSPHMVSDSSMALLRAGYANGVRPDMLVVKMPPPAANDSVDRSDFVPVSIVLPPGFGYARARFGYAENGAIGNFYCTSRLESCVTDSVVKPFAYMQMDTLTATDCRTGCILRIPALSGRILYYRIEKSKDGSSGWVSGSTQVKAVK
jgi:hypothetical protein